MKHTKFLVILLKGAVMINMDMMDHHLKVEILLLEELMISLNTFSKIMDLEELMMTFSLQSLEKEIKIEVDLEVAYQGSVDLVISVEWENHYFQVDWELFLQVVSHLSEQEMLQANQLKQ